MNNEPVAWMFRGYLYEKDPSDWTVHEHPNVPVIPLYTHPADLTDEEIANIFAEHTKIAGAYDVKDIIFPFARAILRKAQEK